ncbi:hypothetical protein L917_20374, partial [Phytophthora nicotianae]
LESSTLALETLVSVESTSQLVSEWSHCDCCRRPLGPARTASATYKHDVGDP